MTQERSNSSAPASSSLSFSFRGTPVPVTHGANVTAHEAALALQSEPFVNWYRRCEQSSSSSSSSLSSSSSRPNQATTTATERIDIQSVEIQSVDLFGARGVGFVKIKADASLVSEGDDNDPSHHRRRRLPGICFLRGNAVTILVALHCRRDDHDKDDTTIYSLLVDQPRVPVGQVSCWELPAGMLDDASHSITGMAVKEMQEECGITIDSDELIDLTQLAFATNNTTGSSSSSSSSDGLGAAGLAPSPGGCDEHCRYFYLEKQVTPAQLEEMKGRLAGLREHGEYITLRVVLWSDLWKVSADCKVMIALFLLEQLRREGKIPPPGQLATPLKTPASSPPSELFLTLSNGQTIPQLAYGMYLVPNDQVGVQTIVHAIQAGYRHFDGASKYGNEAIMGEALQQTGLPRSDFFLVSKVWNDAVKNGRAAVRASVEASLTAVNFGDYFDLFFIHWPVPGHFIEAYKELEELYKEGKIRGIGISNFDMDEYKALVAGGITIPPAVAQMEVSPVMYRPRLVEFFQNKDIVVAAFKALNRAACLENQLIVSLAAKYSVTPAQILLRWSVQKGLIVVSKTATPSRMVENRNLQFTLSDPDMTLLDSLTTEEDVKQRMELERTRKEEL